jgi:hypothetical protein
VAKFNEKTFASGIGLNFVDQGQGHRHLPIADTFLRLNISSQPIGRFDDSKVKAELRKAELKKFEWKRRGLFAEIVI